MSSVDKTSLIASGQLPLGPSTGIDRQNVMRIKVNKVAIVQDLRVEHVTSPLLEKGVISEKDLQKIENGRTPQDRARILVDLLPTKSKNTDWYKHFRDSLQNPDASPETRKRYKHLVDFLDNTVIHRPTSQAGRFRYTNTQSTRSLPPIYSQTDQTSTTLQHYPPLPDIASKETSHEERTPNDLQNPEKKDVKVKVGHQNMTLVKGFFHQWLPTPDNFKSHLEIPQSHLDQLMSSSNPHDTQLIEMEKLAVENLKKVELISALAQRKQLPLGFELCMCDAIQDILNSPDLFHLYMKYLPALEAAEISLVTNLQSSFVSVLQLLESSSTSDIVNQATQLGLKLSHFLLTINKFSEAESTLVSIINFLKQNTNLDFWITRYQAYVKLMLTCNLSYQLDKAQGAYFDAVQMQYQIDMMSFSQKVIYEGSMHAETSHMLLEYGSIVSSLGWARKSLRKTDPNDPASIVRSLCVAIDAYCAHWMVKRAELLAVYVVQYARKYFGERHPAYFDALLHFCHFNTEFKQDESGITAAKELLEVAEKTYGCESIQLALAHREMSKALMFSQKIDEDDYYSHAIEAVRIARSLIGQGDPQLHLFLHTLATALQWKSLKCPKEIKDSTLHWAEAEAKQALAIVTSTFGEISLKSGQMLLLLGQIYSKMNNHPVIEEDLLDVSARLLTQAVDYLKLCQPPSSFYLLFGMANLATFYKILLKPDLAIPRFKYVVEHAESTGSYIHWVHKCYENLASLYNSFGENQEADLIQVKLSHWLKANPAKNEVIDFAVLQEDPIPFPSFITKADIWGTAIQKAMALPSEKAFVPLGHLDKREYIPLVVNYVW
uniref:CARD domain-containing protein n=1 Tax=Biomphalaria glabrata TaxID=6526 RepID=A0A2C9LM96_BIOGL